MLSLSTRVLAVSGLLAGTCAPPPSRGQPVPPPPRITHRAPRPAPPASVPAATQPASAPSTGLLVEPPGGFARFYERVRQVRDKRSRRLRISIWGDSHVAGEVFPDRLRERLQQELGDAGPGFVLLGRPWRSYRHARLKLVESKGWRAERIWSKYSRRHPQPRDDLLGLAGVSVHAPGPATASITLRAPGSLTLIELYYLMQPSGGKIELLVEGKRVKWLFSVASEREAAFARVDLPPGTRRVDLETSGGEVRLFGADLESGAPGAIVDAFGINGARAAKLLEWNEALLGEQLRRLGPDLLVLAYGSNEVDVEKLTAARFAADFDAAIARLQAHAPGAACLVLGPPDQARFRRGSGWALPPSLELIVAEEKRVAALRGCAFFDQRAAMGGPGSIFAWVGGDPALALGDHVHLVAEGYRRLADALYEELRAGWTRAPQPGLRREGEGAVARGRAGEGAVARGR